MTEEQIKNLIRATIEEQSSVSELSTFNVPYHLHNGIDSPNLDYGYISGTVAQSGGVGTVTDYRITTSSIAICTSTNSGNVSFQATSFAGSARFISSDGSSNTLNYIIIL